MKEKTISIEEIGKIIESGSYTTSNEDYKAVEYASKHRNLEIVKHLVTKGFDIHAKNDFLLNWAIKNEYLDVVEYIKNMKNM